MIVVENRDKPLVSCDLTGYALQVAVEESDFMIKHQKRKIERAQRHLARLELQRDREMEELIAYDATGRMPTRKKVLNLIKSFVGRASAAKPIKTTAAKGEA